MRHQLFGSLPGAWVQAQVVRGLFPLHPLTARLLPKISNELAQSNRTMFNFLSPNKADEGGMLHFLQTQDLPQRPADDERLPLFTPDRLLHFFETNLEAREKGGETQASAWLNDYRNAAGKVTGQARAERLLRNLLMLKIVRDNRLAPTADLLFYAQDEPSSQRREFDNLLATLRNWDFLDYNRQDETYDFPSKGGLTASQAENQEESKLAELSLDDCAQLWQQVERRPELRVPQLGTHRVLLPYLASAVADIRPRLTELARYYQGLADPTEPRGLVLYLLAETASETAALAHAARADSTAAPYVLHATPRDPAALEELRAKTRPYRLLQKVLARPDVPPGSSLHDKLTDRLHLAEGTLRTAVKEFFEPMQWQWCYGGEAGTEFTSRRKFDDWLSIQLHAQFEQTPDVRDDALWFVSRTKNRKERQDAFATLYTALPNLLPLKKPGYALADRILENLLYHLSLQKTTTKSQEVQYCEMRDPTKGTPEAAIFTHFDAALKEAALVPAQALFAPLLQAPFGLSDYLAKFFFGLYNRLNTMQLTIYKGKAAVPMSLELLEALFLKPTDYTVRRVPLSAPVRRYLLRLRELFREQNANSFADVTRQFKGVLLTPVQRALLARRPDQALAFYDTLAGLSISLGETEAQELFLDTLPNTLLNLTDRDALLDHPDQVEKLVKRLGELKELPAKEEAAFQLETLRNLGQALFKVSVATKDDLQAAAKAWYANLQDAKRLARYENPRLNQWLELLRDGPQAHDLALWYLRDLTEHPLREWADNLPGRQLALLEEFAQYKTTVETFTKPALPLLQHLARGAFEVPATECASESAVAELFRSWHRDLPTLTRQHAFTDLAVSWLLTNITSTAPVAQTYLDTIPRRWREQGTLRTMLADAWEDWSDTALAAVADEYERCVAAVNDWQPPVAEADFFGQLGAAFDLPDTDTAARLLAALQADWLPTLPELTRSAPWANQPGDDASLMKHLLHGGDAHQFFSQTLPARWQLGQLATMDGDAVRQFVEKVAALRQSIEAYRRPLLEVAHKLKRSKTDRYETLKDYQNTLTNSLRDTAAFRHQAENDPTLTDAPARLLLAQLRKGVALDKLVPAFATALGLPAEQHCWTKEEEEQFVAAWKAAQNLLLDWKFPEDRNLTNAKQKLSAQVQALQVEFGLTPAQLRKILDDLMPA